MADLTPEEIARNIEALKQKKGDARTGGKGSQRRKVKVVHKNPVLWSLMQVNDDKKIKTIVKKLGVQPLQTIDEVNFFKDDNTVMHFTKPDGIFFQELSPCLHAEQYIRCYRHTRNQDY